MSQEKKKIPRRRILSFMLALCMILTAFPATSLWAAEDQTESANVTVSEAADKAVDVVDENTVEAEAVSGTVEETPTVPEEKSNTYNNTDKTENPGVIDVSENALNKVDVAPNEYDSLEPKASNGTMSGNCGKDGGDNVKWRLESDGLYNTLIISGTGEMEDYDVKDRPWSMFNESIRTITIENGVTNIGNKAFAGCGSGLGVTINVNIPDSVTKIGDKAFSWCDNIVDINIPDSVISIGSYAFDNCGRLTNVKMSNNAVDIGEYAFYRCYHLSNIELPNSISQIGRRAFCDCWSFTSVNIPRDITKIEEGTFWGCKNLTNVNISNGLTAIGYIAFAGCERLTNINLPNSVISIGVRAFSGCSALPSIFIPKSVSSIAMEALESCTNLNDIYYEGGPISWKALDNYIASNTFNDDFVVDKGPRHTAKIHFNSKVEDRKQQYAIAYMNDEDKAQEVFDCSLENCLKDDKGQNKDSSEYNPQLAHMSIALCNSIHSAWCTELTYQNLGFDAQIRVDDKLLTYGVGTKRVGNETLVLVVARGTVDIEEFFDNLGVGINKSYHKGFHDAANVLYNGVTGFLQQRNLAINSDNLKFVITGHSRGAAAANIMAARLVNEGINQNNIYAYTFACPDVAFLNKGTINTYKCIYNINNANDMVTWVPSSIWTKSANNYNHQWDSNAYWDKYGRSYWYAKDWNDYRSLHAKFTTSILSRINNYHLQGIYLGDLRTENSLSSYKDREATTEAIDTALKRQKEEKPSFSDVPHYGEVRYGGILCPVDLKIYTSNGLLVGSVTNNVVDRIESDKVHLYVDGDKKYFYLLDDDDYTFRLTGTADGTMKYFIQNMNPEPDGTFKEKVFENVALTNGKEMASQVSVWDDNDENIKDEDKIDIQDVKLLVLDDEGKPEKEVLTDGKGTEVPIGAESITPSPSVSGAPSVTGSPSSPGVPSVPGTEPSVTGTPAVTPTTTPTVTPGGDETPVVTPPSATETPTATPSVGTETPAVSPTPIVTPSITPTPTNTPTPGGNIGNGVMVKKLKIIGSSKRIAAGKKLKLKVAVSPANATNKAVTWKSSNTKYATVNSKGIVTIKKAAGGKTVIITATAKDGSGIKASYKIQCMKGIVKKVTIVGKKTRTIKAGKSIKLKVKVNATKGANKTLKWSSSNTKYATVNSKGKVTTKKAGKGKTIKITATATDGSGKKASVKVKIK